MVLLTSHGRLLFKFKDRDGTNGVDGLPGVASVIPVTSRQARVDLVTAANQYALRDSATNSVPDDAAWDSVASITVFRDATTEALANVVVDDETHIRVRFDDTNWGWFLITADPTLETNQIVFTVDHIQDRGVIIAGTNENVPAGIGLDIARGERGDSALAVNVSLSQNSVTAQTQNLYPATNITVSGAFSFGSTDAVVRTVGTISIATDGTATFNQAAGATNPVTLGSVAFTPTLNFTAATRSIALTLAGITDRATVTLGNAGAEGATGATGAQGERGLGGAPGAGLYNRDLPNTQAELDALNDSQLSTQFQAGSGRTPVAGDILVLNGNSGAVRTIVRNSTNTAWVTQAAFIDGGLVVNGTITTDQIAANTITAGDIATGTITAASGVIGSLDAGTITTGILSADRLQIDDATLDTDANGNLVVNTANGGGLVITPNGLEVGIDGVTVVIDANGDLTAPQLANPAVITLSGGQTARSFTVSTPGFQLGGFGSAGRTISGTPVSNFFWRATGAQLSIPDPSEITGVQLENWDASYTYVTDGPPALAYDQLSVAVNLQFGAGTGSTTGINTTGTVSFDGTYRRSVNVPSSTAGVVTIPSGNATYSTLGGTFSFPTQASTTTPRVYFFQVNTTISARSASNNNPSIGGGTLTTTFPAQTDTILRILLRDGTDTTLALNSFFI